MDVCAYFNYEDLFAAGIGFDIAGAFLLARGLLVSPKDLALRASTFVGANPHTTIAAAEDRADGEIGIAALIGGFVLQAAGYVVAEAGVAAVPDGSSGAVVAAIVVVAVAVMVVLSRGLRYAPVGFDVF